MSKRKDGLQNIELFTFKTTSPVVARRFRDHCYKKGLIMGAAFERMMIDYLIRVGDVESEESIRIEEALTK